MLNTISFLIVTNGEANKACLAHQAVTPRWALTSPSSTGCSQQGARRGTPCLQHPTQRSCSAPSSKELTQTAHIRRALPPHIPQHSARGTEGFLLPSLQKQNLCPLPQPCLLSTQVPFHSLHNPCFPIFSGLLVLTLGHILPGAQCQGEAPCLITTDLLCSVHKQQGFLA